MDRLERSDCRLQPIPHTRDTPDRLPAAQDDPCFFICLPDAPAVATSSANCHRVPRDVPTHGRHAAGLAK